MDLAVAHPKRLNCASYQDDIAKIEEAVGNLFSQVILALKETDKRLADKLIKDNWWILKRCDEIVKELIVEKDPDIGSGDAASTAIYSRYLKRIAAHLINIASGVVRPFESIGFHDDKET